MEYVIQCVALVNEFQIFQFPFCPGEFNKGRIGLENILINFEITEFGAPPIQCFQVLNCQDLQLVKFYKLDTLSQVILLRSSNTLVLEIDNKSTRLYREILSRFWGKERKVNISSFFNQNTCNRINPNQTCMAAK